MTHALTTLRTIPAPTPEVTKSLSPQQVADHRQQIASEVKVVLSAYYQPSEDDRTKAAALAWWCDELEDWTIEQVVWGLREWNRTKPRLRPTPGDVLAVLKARRGQSEAARMKPPEPEQHKAVERTPEQKAEIAAIVARFNRGKAMHK